VPEYWQSLKAWIYQAIAFFILLSIMHALDICFGCRFVSGIHAAAGLILPVHDKVNRAGVYLNGGRKA